MKERGRPGVNWTQQPLMKTMVMCLEERNAMHACTYVCMYIHVQTYTLSAQANSSKGGAHCEWSDVAARQN